MNPFSTLKKLIRSKPVVDNMEQELKAMNKANWRTTMHGIIFGALMLASIWAPPSWHDKLQGTADAFAVMGFISAADKQNLK